MHTACDSLVPSWLHSHHGNERWTAIEPRRGGNCLSCALMRAQNWRQSTGDWQHPLVGGGLSSSLESRSRVIGRVHTARLSATLSVSSCCGLGCCRASSVCLDEGEEEERRLLASCRVRDTRLPPRWPEQRRPTARHRSRHFLDDNDRRRKWFARTKCSLRIRRPSLTTQTECLQKVRLKRVLSFYPHSRPRLTLSWSPHYTGDEQHGEQLRQFISRPPVDLKLVSRAFPVCGAKLDAL